MEGTIKTGPPYTREFAGAFAVDSGRLVICDPCHAWDAGPRPDGTFEDYGDEVSDALAEEEFASIPCDCGECDGVPVVFASHTGYGDGVYPVFAVKNTDGRVVRLEIELGFANEVNEYEGDLP